MYSGCGFPNGIFSVAIGLAADANAPINFSFLCSFD
jgi:hypothetical protein